MKKFVSILLALVLAASLTVAASATSVYGPGSEDVKTSEEAIKEYEEVNGVTVSTYRYYFQMPNGSNGPLATKDVTYEETDEETGEKNTVVVCAEGDHAPSWYNEYTEGAGVYWWGSAEAAPDAWAGYRAMVADADQSIYYVDLPTAAVVFIWNNGVDGGTDKTAEIYYKAAQTVDVACEYPDPGEYVGMPEGADNFNNGIFIINPDKVEQNPFSKKMTCGGTWYFYYEDGCYGMYATDSAKFVSVEANCCNPDHYENGDITGTHIGAAPAVTYVRGDYDEDTQVTIMDATRAQNILAENLDRPAEEFLAGVDADGDGNLTIMDATRIQNVLAELINMDGTPFVEET